MTCEFKSLSRGDLIYYVPNKTYFIFLSKVINNFANTFLIYDIKRKDIMTLKAPYDILYSFEKVQQ
jgi:hypothetical protein